MEHRFAGTGPALLGHAEVPGLVSGRRAMRAVATAVLAALTLTACAAGPSGFDDDPDGVEQSAGVPDPVALDRVEESAREDVPSALANPTDPDLPEPLIDPARLLKAGPAPDGIPAIDEPLFEQASTVSWLEPGEPVLSLEIDGETRAYPVQIMIWHEIVNDVVGGVPVAVTYCPLCNSALTFDRRVADRIVSFGTSGMLYNSDLVMYDRQTESLWPQIELEAVAGHLTGTRLEPIPTVTVAWSDFMAAHPDAWVLSRSSGGNRPYGSNPYVGYGEPESWPFAFDGDVPPPLFPKDRVAGLGASEDPVAVPLTRLAEEKIVEVTVAGQPVVLWYLSGLRSALDAPDVADGPQIGAVVAYEPTWDRQELTFSVEDDRFVDDQTGSTWDFLGRAIAGPAEGARLSPVQHLDTFWFAWTAFHPETRLAD